MKKIYSDKNIESITFSLLGGWVQDSACVLGSPILCFDNFSENPKEIEKKMICARGPRSSTMKEAFFDVNLFRSLW